MTHKFEIKETIEITFPHYRKYLNFYYKVLSPTMEISVMYFPEGANKSARIGYDNICEGNTFRYGSYEITEDEFNKTYDLAFDLIHGMQLTEKI